MHDPFDPHRPLDEIAFALFDVETTGLSPAYGHRVCEVACLRLRDGVELDRFESFVDPERAISAGAYHVNRITPEMLAGAPAFETVAGTLLAMMEDAVLVAHNAPFDLGFLAKELSIARVPPPEGPVVDTLSLSRRIYTLPSHSLAAVATFLEAPSQPVHRAMSDVEATRHVLDRMFWDLDRRWGVTTLGQLIDFQGGPIPYPYPRQLPLPPDIADALESRGRVYMRYVNAQGVESERVVRPIHIAERHGYLYLSAHCYQAGALRTFRLDRVVEMAVAEEAGD
ncbi:MAG TPA: exonuclease domain-containing protein [Anaerolineae bacterium]|nr:exonuclease domain-containing protein [Anaerolineae bacterium]